MNIMNFVTRQVSTLSPADPIDRAIALMEENGIHHIAVKCDDRLVGMVSDRDVLVSTGWMLVCERQVSDALGVGVVGPTRVEQIMSRPVISLSNADSARDAATAMTIRKIGAIPVLSDGRLVGIVTDTDLVRWLRELATTNTAADRVLSSPVSTRMRTMVVSAAPDDPLSDIVDTFRSCRFRHVPVTVDQRLVGVISDRDVRRALGWTTVRSMQAARSGESIDAPRRAADIMQTNVITATSKMSLRDALASMIYHQVHSLPVVDGMQLKGIITVTDYVKAIAREELL
ncbi:MAG: CBS domain-containing protein [Phycisphaerales bacterium]|nr:CBS domain-containing protein [Phycisphaerales bacterium]